MQLDGVWSRPESQIDSQTSFGTSMQYLQMVDAYVPAEVHSMSCSPRTAIWVTCMAWSCRGALPRRAFGTTPGGRRYVVEYAAVVMERRAKMSLEGDIVVGVVVMVVVVSVVGMGSSTVSSSVLVLSACEANVMYSLETLERRVLTAIRAAKRPARASTGASAL